MVDLTNASWRKSSRSASNGGACVEVADLPGLVAVRDSKNPGGPALVFSPGAFAGLVNGISSRD